MSLKGKPGSKGFPFEHQTPTDPRPLERLRLDRSCTIDVLTTAFLLQDDVGLRRRLAKIATGDAASTFVVAVRQNDIRLRVNDAGEVVPVRTDPEGWPFLDLPALLSTDPALAHAIEFSFFRQAATISATELVRPIFEMGSAVTRQQFQALAYWSVLLEQSAYRSLTHLGLYVDMIRPVILGSIKRGEDVSGPIGNYWWAIHTICHLTLLASDLGARPWLAEMAGQFRWRNWTPSYVLTRERTIWLAAAGARSAMAFGTPVVDHYLHLLSASRQPMQAFDALYGLTAIALSSPNDARKISSQIQRVRLSHLRAVVGDHHYFDLAYSEAVQTISKLDDDRWDRTLTEAGLPSARGLATRSSFIEDPASVTNTGHFNGFAMLPQIALTAREEHYAVAAIVRREAPVSRTKIAEIFHDAWVGGEALVQGTVH